MKYFIANPLKFGSSDSSRSSIGHASHNWITAYIISKLANIEFVHSPFTNDCAKYESVLNLSHKLKTENNNVNAIEIPLIDFSNESQFLHNKEKLLSLIKNAEDGSRFRFTSYSQFSGLLIKDAQFLTDIFQESYWTKHSGYKTIYDPSRTNVAIHIRRGDITERLNSDRWKSNSYYNDVIQKISNKEKNATFYIFSEGSESDFSEIKGDNIKFILNGNDVDSFHHMCHADKLVTGQSTFSILAAYINKNTILYTDLMNYTRWEKFGNRFINLKDY